MRPTVPLEQIVRELAGQAESLCRELLPGGVKDGHEWRCGSLAGEAGRSMAVHLTGAKAGVWMDFASGEAGDALDLVAAALHRGDKREAVRWARRWLGYDDGPGVSVRRREVQRDAAKVDDGAERAQRHAAALRMFLAAQPSLVGTPAWAYLAGRAIDLAKLGRQPRALRFHPSLYHGPSGRRWPALVAAVSNAAGQHVATHRTWLGPKAGGGWGKAPVEPAKASYGAVRGGAIRLWRGRAGSPWREATAEETVALAEGIEDALTVALACPEWRVAAVVSAGNLPSVALPPLVRDVVLVRQRDGENREVRRAQETALARWQAEGRSPRVVDPPAGFKDFNDWAQAKMLEATA